jgi:hypothetical protein
MMELMLVGVTLLLEEFGEVMGGCGGGGELFNGDVVVGDDERGMGQRGRVTTMLVTIWWWRMPGDVIVFCRVILGSVG